MDIEVEDDVAAGVEDIGVEVDTEVEITAVEDRTVVVEVGATDVEGLTVEVDVVVPIDVVDPLLDVEVEVVIVDDVIVDVLVGDSAVDVVETDDDFGASHATFVGGWT